MNLCILKGKTIEEIEFKFILKGKNISIAKTKIELENKSKIRIKGYNEMADWMYQKLRTGQEIFLKGRIEYMEIRIEWIEIFIEKN